MFGTSSAIVSFKHRTRGVFKVASLPASGEGSGEASYRQQCRAGSVRRELSLESQRLGRRERGQERRPRGEGGPGAGRDSPAEQARQGHRGRRNSRSKGPGVGMGWAGCVPETGRKPVRPEERDRWEVYSGRARRGPRGPLTPTSRQGRVTRAATPGPAPSESLGAEPWRGYV